MPLKTKKKVEVVESEVVQQEQPEVLTEEEIKAIKNEDEKVCADTRRLQLANEVVSKQFNLDLSYSISKFDDKGKVVNLTLENSNFILSVTIKDSDKHGMYVEQ